MFLHLGGDVLINQEKIIAILDLESAVKNPVSEKFLKKIEESNRIEYICEHGKEKSFIITTDKSYFSPISSTTLLKRSSSIDDHD